MALARTAGRKGRPWRTLRAKVLHGDPPCVWCGHGGCQDVNHNVPRSRARHLALTRSNLSPIHGRAGCPTCGRRCNSELGARVIGVDVMPPGQGSRDW